MKNYYLKFNYNTNIIGYLGLICSDYPNRDYDDIKIYYKCHRWAKELNKMFNDCIVEVEERNI